MNKNFKLLTVFTVAIMIIACLGVLVACGENPDNNGGGVEPDYTFKFTFVDTDGNGIKNLEIQLCELNSKGEVKACLGHTKITNEKGVVYFIQDEDGSYLDTIYGIHVLNDDMEYTFDNTAHKTSQGVSEYTLTLEKK